MISAINFNEAVEVYTEAVFTNGKATLKPIVDQFQVIKDLLESQIKDHRETAKDAGNAMAKAKIGEITGKVTIKAFNPEAFWRNTEWKKLEDIIQNMFGLRVCKINPYNEKYNMGKGEFESKELNAYVYRRTRYPVEGLITEKGFFDKSHSLDLDMYISLGLLRYLTASEIVAVMLHEFGHSIDPALCDIKYTGTNILCKYITDRKGAINKEEQRLISDRNKVANESKGLIILPFFSMIGSKIKNGVKNLFSAIKGWFTKKEKKDENITEGVLDIFQSSSKRQDIKLKKLQKIIEQDMIEFNRKEYSEAFADNFARMYGFGAEMASALKKLSKDVDTKISRIDKERKREDIIYNIAESAIKDVHKTDVHRIKALIKEYKDDINDPNTPAEVKKQLEADAKEVELVLDQFMNDFSEFQNRINKLISEELDKMNITDDEVKKESAEESESYDMYIEADQMIQPEKIKKEFVDALKYTTVDVGYGPALENAKQFVDVILKEFNDNSAAAYKKLMNIIIPAIKSVDDLFNKIPDNNSRKQGIELNLQLLFHDVNSFDQFKQKLSDIRRKCLSADKDNKIDQAMKKQYNQERKPWADTFNKPQWPQMSKREKRKMMIDQLHDAYIDVDPNISDEALEKQYNSAKHLFPYIDNRIKDNINRHLNKG